MKRLSVYRPIGALALLGTVGTLYGVLWAITDRSQAAVEGATSETSDIVPVEDDVHEFMEYYFQPTYRRLRQTMAHQQFDNSAWKAVKSDGLILAEGANLLFSRGPVENRQAWNDLAVHVRKAGSALYGAGKKKDLATARKAYTQTITACNACHDAFADGEHQLDP